MDGLDVRMNDFLMRMNDFPMRMNDFPVRTVTVQLDDSNGLGNKRIFQRSFLIRSFLNPLMSFLTAVGQNQRLTNKTC